MKPKVGVLVHYKEDGEPECQAAIILNVVPVPEGMPDLEKVRVIAYHPYNEDENQFYAEHSEDKHFAGTWHSVEGCGG